ncbi:Fc.00g042560.m01.CDS01 [Cosmosporella sp. VM-42]
MTSAELTRDRNNGELQSLLREIDEYRLSPQEIQDAIPEESVLSEIPRNDITYTSISSTLIPHTRFPNMYLLEYCTFAGTQAYQPCSNDIDSIGIFQSLTPIETNGDSLFKNARTWSCVMQAMPGLPKDIR